MPIISVGSKLRVCTTSINNNRLERANVIFICTRITIPHYRLYKSG